VAYRFALASVLEGLFLYSSRHPFVVQVLGKGRNIGQTLSMCLFSKYEKVI
jgi:hypothetical protein